jgi:hypothetical protein
LEEDKMESNLNIELKRHGERLDISGKKLGGRAFRCQGEETGWRIVPLTEMGRTEHHRNLAR